MRETLTEKDYWDQHWATLKLPVSYTLDGRSELNADILGTIERAVGDRRPKKVLEIGGAPGGFLAHFAKRYGSEVHSLDYSEIGCRKTEENFRLLDLPVHIHRADFLNLPEGLPRFDVVYSLGLIEHFSDLPRVVKAHCDLVNPRGLIILGVPHFVHVFWPLLYLLAPRVTGGHNRDVLSLDRWNGFERQLSLKPVYKGYMGGFRPRLMSSVIREEYSSGGGRLHLVGRLIMRLLDLSFSARRRLLTFLPGLEGAFRIEGRLLSAYAMGAYTLEE